MHGRYHIALLCIPNKILNLRDKTSNIMYRNVAIIND